MWLTRISIKNPYFATVMMLAILLLGLISMNRIAVEQFPQIKFPVVVVTTSYTGASPDVMESDVTKPIEQAVNTLNNIKEVRSYSREGTSWVIAIFNLQVKPEVATQDVRDKVAAVAAGFKKDINTPVISGVNQQDDNPIASLAISSDTVPLREVTDWVVQVAQKRIQTIAGVGDVALAGGVQRQIRINIEPYKLQSLGLSIADVSTAIKNANQNYPAGNIKGDTTEIKVRLEGKLRDVKDFAKIVIKYKNNNVPVLLSDVATIIDGQEEQSGVTLTNGQEAVGLDIRQTNGANVVEVVDNIHKMIAELNKIKPSGIKIAVTYDQSIAVKASLANVEDTLIEGALLTIAIVFVFLKSWRSTVITGLTLPISLLGTIFAIYICGFTLNMMSLMALSLSIGLLIDDAIVVRENIVRHLHMGKNHFQAALDGTNEIGMAVFSTTLTLVAVFLPVGFMSGIIGKFFFQFGITVTVAVLISLLVSFTLDPMLSSVWHEPKDGGWLHKSILGKYLDAFEVWFDKLAIFYEKVIRRSLKFKKTTILIAVGILFGSFALVPFIGAEFIPQADTGQYQAKFKTPAGSNLNYTKQKAEQVADILKSNIPEITTLTINVAGVGNSSNDAGFVLDVGDKQKRHRGIDKIIQQTRQLMSQVGGIEVKNIMSLGGAGDGGQPIRVEIKGDSVERLKEIAANLSQKIAKIKGVVDLSNSYLQGDPAYSIKLDRDIAANLGVNLDDVGLTMSVLFAGNKVTSWEDPKNGQNYDVVLQIPQSERNTGVLDLLKVSSSRVSDDGTSSMVPLSVIAKTSNTFSPRSIDHTDLHRKITISGNMVGNNAQSIYGSIQKILNSYELPSGYSLMQKGSKDDMQDSFMAAVAALATGIVFIYMILTAQFRSFILPLVIMVSLPLSFVGVFIALLLCNSTLNLYSIIGIIMLMGLATKNGILLVDFINQQLRNGMTQMEAIVSAGRVRLRPIIMTTMAMIFGMLPLALSTGTSSESSKPMAYAIIGGMITSTLLTLIVIPVVYVYMDKFSKFIQKSLNKNEAE